MRLAGTTLRRDSCARHSILFTTTNHRIAGLEYPMWDEFEARWATLGMHYAVRPAKAALLVNNY
ncbi:MAG TPA: hypothetical protein PK156_20440 [Polyangium sp.]|nr:hypothetical protein [Polyangium sp.]